jgi:hypothetical protein
MKSRILYWALLATGAHAAPIDYEEELPVPVGVSVEKLLVYPSKPSDDFSLADAEKLCERYRERYGKKYFEVVCVLKERHRYLDYYDYVYLPKWKKVGTEVREVTDWWGYYERTERPLWRKVHIRRREWAGSITHTKRAIEVYGIGELAALEPQVLYSSLEVSETSGVPLRYKRGLAQYYCGEQLRHRRRRARRSGDEFEEQIYNHAECRYRGDPEIKEYWYYEIITKNPYY